MQPTTSALGSSVYELLCEVVAGTFRPTISWHYANGSKVFSSIDVFIRNMPQPETGSELLLLDFRPFKSAHVGDYICNTSISANGVSTYASKVITVTGKSKDKIAKQHKFLI